MRFSSFLGAALLPFAATVGGIEFNPDDEVSIKAVTRQYAYGLMSYYVNNATGTAEQDIGVFPKPPHYWWEAGAAWGGMIEYTQLTGDTSHQQTLQQALVANYGPNNDIVLPWRKDQEGNDDQAFWAFAVMSAIEYQFPEPDAVSATYLQVVESAFNSIVARWDTTSCNGGLKWQIYPENDYGYNYKNSIGNGATFALAARLARYTGNQTYADWAVKIWNWQKAVGLMSNKYEVFDGTDDKKNCTDQEKTEWTYNIAVYLHGAAVMYNHTKGDETWKKHTSGLLEHTAIFFKPYDNATDIMFEQRCETFEKCNIDQLSFKAYLGRFLAKTAIMAPFTKEQVTTWLRASAVGAAKSCAGKDESACGSKWYVDGWDGTAGVGQQLSALEVTQALLTLKKGVVPGTGGKEPSPSSSTTPGASSTSSAVEVSSKWISTLPITATSSVGSSADISSTDVLTSAASSTVPASSDAATAPSTSALASSDAAPATSTKAGAELGEQPTAGSASASTTCAPTSTTTLYVPPSSSSKCSSNSTTTTTVYVPPTVSAAPTHSANATVSISPPANTTGPEQFPGTATHNRVAAITVVVAALIVAVSLMS